MEPARSPLRSNHASSIVLAPGRKVSKTRRCRNHLPVGVIGRRNVPSDFYRLTCYLQPCASNRWVNRIPALNIQEIARRRVDRGGIRLAEHPDSLGRIKRADVASRLVSIGAKKIEEEVPPIGQELRQILHDLACRTVDRGDARHPCPFSGSTRYKPRLPIGKKNCSAAAPSAAPRAHRHGGNCFRAIAAEVDRLEFAIGEKAHDIARGRPKGMGSAFGAR